MTGEGGGGVSSNQYCASPPHFVVDAGRTYRTGKSFIVRQGLAHTKHYGSVGSSALLAEFVTKCNYLIVVCGPRPIT
jgi:hypothetical protein